MVAQQPKHRRSYQEARHERLTPQERKAFLDALRTSSSRRKACDMAMISYNTLEKWLMQGEGTYPGRQATPWHKRLLAEVKQAEASPLVLMQAKAVARGDVRYMMARWPEEFSGQPDVSVSATSYVQQNMILIPPDRIPEFLRSLARPESSQLEATSDGPADHLARLRLIEE